MAGSLNKATIIGHLGADPVIRTFPDGKKVCNFRVATSETWKDKNTGEKKEKSEWHSIAIFQEGLVNIANQYLQKGSKVYLEGQLQTRKWQDKNGADRYSTEIVLKGFGSKLLMLNNTGNSDNKATDSDANAPSGYDQSQGGGMDDEIPF